VEEQTPTRFVDSQNKIDFVQEQTRRRLVQKKKENNKKTMVEEEGFVDS
jgi:hypothetical protein